MEPLRSASIAALATILAASIGANAYADDAKIWTSADSHGKKFFGESVLQIVISYPDESSGIIETATVRVDATSDNGRSGTSYFEVFETGKSTGKFELFLKHEDSDAVPPGSLDPINSDGVEGEDANGDGISTGAPIIEFGPDATDADSIRVDSELYEPASFEITVSGAITVISYEESSKENQPVQTWDPLLSSGKETYRPGEEASIRIADPDANADNATIDSVMVKVSFGNGTTKEIPAFETEKDAGVFEASFLLPDYASSRNVTVVYADKRPADYSNSVGRGQSPEKEFFIQIKVEARYSFSVLPPSLSNDGKAVSVTIVNDGSRARTFTSILEVRNSGDTTVFLELSTGVLGAGNRTEVSLPWTPQGAGMYHFRAFVISSDLEVLSQIAASQIFIGR